jgi:predicted 3-demethylubiquinone-9 3-methyltransferase (glyoxalase superfamily)
MATPKQRIAPFLMFAGNAEEALRYYVATFPQSETRCHRQGRLCHRQDRRPCRPLHTD